MSLINNILSTIKYEVSEVRKNRLYCTTLLFLPLATILFFGTMFYSGSIEDLPIVVVDNDHSASSRQLLEMVAATRGVAISDQTTSVLEAEDMLRRGDVYALLLVPQGLEQNIYAGSTTNIECYISGTNLSASGIIESELQNSIRSLSSGIEFSKLTANGVNSYQAMQDTMPINFLTHIVSNPYINYGYYLSPIFMFMALSIFTTLLTVYAFGRELYYATAPEWIATARDNLFAATVGKLLPTTAVMIIFSQLIFYVLFVVMGMECAGSYAILSLASVVFIAAHQAVALFITTITSNMRLALSLGGGYAVMAFTFSGITFPTSAMFDVAKALSNIFPLTWFSEIFIDQAMRGAPIFYSIKSLLLLLTFTFLPLLTATRLRTVCSESKYWSKD